MLFIEKLYFQLSQVFAIDAMTTNRYRYNKTQHRSSTYILSISFSLILLHIYINIYMCTCVYSLCTTSGHHVLMYISDRQFPLLFLMLFPYYASPMLFICIIPALSQNPKSIDFIFAFLIGSLYLLVLKYFYRFHVSNFRYKNCT